MASCKRLFGNAEFVAAYSRAGGEESMSAEMTDECKLTGESRLADIRSAIFPYKSEIFNAEAMLALIREPSESGEAGRLGGQGRN